MAKAGFVTYLIALSITFISAYEKDCARGPQYWCQSFATANDCGALRHCTDTVWKNDEDRSKTLSTTSCEWCQKILNNAYTSIQHLANNNELIKTKVTSGCRLFPLASLSTKCTHALEHYGETVATLMKAQRYGTLCHLMDICVAEPTSTQAPETEKPIIVGSHRCTWGPAYWCSSLSNSRECGSTEHCSNEIWSQQTLEKKANDNICQYCEYTINKLRDILTENKTEIVIEQWLAGACSMLPSKQFIDECVATMSKYAEEVVVLIRSDIEPGIICQLAQMCKEATIKTRVMSKPGKKEEQVQEHIDEHPVLENIPVDEESKMLCHVIVQATHELVIVQQKTRNEVQTFLNNDCQKLPKPELIEKCDSLIHRYGHDIYGHVASNVELSKICDHLDDFTDHTAAAGLPPVHCELCRFVLSTAKYMLDANQADDKILSYIDEQVCSRLPSGMKKTCQAMVSDNGKVLLDDIRSGSNSMLLCTRFQVCLEQVFERHSPISKDELHGFIKKNICDQLGTFREACYAMLEQDTNRLLKTLVQDLEGDTLCALSGICPQKMSFFDNLATNDDKNKCKRCIDDFTRRKHIAEKLVNHSAEFLHRLCGQLPEKDSCDKAVDDSIKELVDFVRSLDPQDICVQLKICDKAMLTTIKATELTTSQDLISHEVMAYIKIEVCTKLGVLEALCNKTIEMEGPAILANIAKDINPKKACQTIGVCQTESAFSNCNDKCECCMGQVEVHEVRIATFLRSMVNNIRTICTRMPTSATCLQMTTKFDDNVDRITSKFNAKRACELLNHCSATPVEIETLPQCQKRIESKQQFLLNAITTINQNLKSLCEYVPWNKDCYTIIDRSTLEVEDILNNLNNEAVCVSGKSLAEYVCQANNPFKSLCQQLVHFDGDHTRLESLFKSIFNQNGNVEKNLCEIETDSSDCVPSVDLKNCKDKCDCCVQFYTTKKNYDLSMIETLRSGLLATCDWSLTKDYCISWFNRVCDRMKAKEDQFMPTTYCKRMGFCPIEETTPKDAVIDKCQICTSRLNTNQQRFRSMVDDLTMNLLSFCTDTDCRSLVQTAQQKTIDQISKIDSQKLCQRYGYCAPEHSSETIGYHSRLLANPYHHIGSSIEALDLRFETALSSDLCFQYGQLRSMCEHLLASAQGNRYADIYKALMKDDTKLIDDDLREQLQTKPGTPICDACKNAVQSGKDFWINSLDVVHNVMLQACERCPKKDECKAFYDQRFQRMKNYINSIDADLFCQSVHLCASKSQSQSKIIIDELNQCTTCINYFDQRKENLEQGVNRLIPYLKDLCQRYSLKQCDDVLQGLQQNILPTVKNLQSKQVCSELGFCSLSAENGAMSFDYYRKAIEDELEEKICSSLGPFESLCQQVLHGNRKQVQTVKINDNIRDLLHIGEDKISVNLLSAVNQAECARDGCQCCINRIEDKKKCLTNMATQVFSVLIKSCDYCPSKDSCRKYWSSEQDQCVSSIKSIDSKQICTKLGFCNVSSLCAKMNLFQDECERLLAQFTQSSSVIEQHLPHTSVVVLPTKEEKTEIDQVHDSNATCILCEYFMHMVTKYISQNSTEEQIEQSLEKICQQMPKSLTGQCKEFVDNYAPVIVATLIQDFDATTVCRRLNLCTKQMKVNLSHLTKADPAACGVCDYMATYVRFTLNRDPSGKSIPSALRYVCAHLSDQQKPQCQTLVQLFGSQMKALKLDLGDNFCQHLAICETPKLVRVPLKKEEPKEEKDDEYKRKIVKNLDETPQCTICHFVISYLDAALKNNKSEEAFEAALEKVCKILPTKERAQCNDFIKSYGPVLAELISEMADPDLVCRYLGLCQVSTPVEVTTKKPLVIGGGTHDYKHLPVQDAPFTCTICQYIIGRMKHFVTLNQTEEEILASLKESCDLFSVLNLKEQCRTFLDDYGQYIIQMVASDVEPKVACQSMGICEKTSAPVSAHIDHPETAPEKSSPKADYTKCIFGMSYWCTSRQNAELCNAVEICETEVWSKKNKNIVI